MIEYIKSKPKFTELLLTHLSTSAVMDLLLRLITCVEGNENKQNILTVRKQFQIELKTKTMHMYFSG